MKPGAHFQQAGHTSSNSDAAGRRFVDFSSECDFSIRRIENPIVIVAVAELDLLVVGIDARSGQYGGQAVLDIGDRLPGVAQGDGEAYR